MTFLLLIHLFPYIVLLNTFIIYYITNCLSYVIYLYTIHILLFYSILYLTKKIKRYTLKMVTSIHLFIYLMSYVLTNYSNIYIVLYGLIYIQVETSSIVLYLIHNEDEIDNICIMLPYHIYNALDC